jgi:RNA polymerase sigma-70 factor (ECF subfamily)
MKPQPVPQLDSRIPDADLAPLVEAGDEAAIRLLMRRHNQKLFRAARSILRDDAEAEDALQEAYLAAFRAIGSFRSDAKLSTWLTRIVVNESLGACERAGGARRSSRSTSTSKPIRGTKWRRTISTISPSARLRDRRRAPSWSARSTSCPMPSARCSCCARSRR